MAAGRRVEKREDLKRRLIDAAEVRIGKSGLAALRARDLAEDAGCALGAIYNAFEDMDDLILRVNARTLARLGQMASGTGASDPGARLKELALAYAAFASENTNLWAAIFEHRMAGDRPTPEWYLQENAVLIEQIVKPVAKLRPGLAQRELLVRARTLFSAVHGIVTISIENRFVGIPAANLKAELERFVDVLVTGIEGTPDR
ncbi:MAG TPA: TetR/AcrR family transcriptional regulator [Rhizobiaceae bacterium]|nr:TetR/AcrR family transcriptional regulator [Rhizobiaceae bacterium]